MVFEEKVVEVRASMVDHSQIKNFYLFFFLTVFSVAL